MCTGKLMNKQSNESPWSRLVRVPDGGYLVTTLINPKLANIIVPIAAAVTLTGAAGPSQAAHGLPEEEPSERSIEPHRLSRLTE